VESLRLALRRERWRAEEAERFGRELAAEQARTAAALAAERSAHETAQEMLRRYRIYTYELEDRARAMDSGFTRLMPPLPPRRVIEEDARPPKQGTPAAPPGKERKNEP
jgi:hypothetical protein